MFGIKSETQRQEERRKDFSHSVHLAADWWAKKLQRLPDLNYGNPHSLVHTTFVQDRLTSTLDTPGQIATFKRHFELAALDTIARLGGRYLSVQVDYHPSDVLHTALTAAKVDITPWSLPLKVRTTIYKDRVEILDGVGSEREPPVILYTDPRRRPDVTIANCA